METKTLIILTPGFPKDEHDSVCLPTQQLFVRTVHELFPSLQIKVVSLHYPYHKNHYRWNGIDVYPLHGNSKAGPWRWLLWHQCYTLLSDLTNDHACAGIISFWCNETALIGNYFAKRRHIKHKIWICGQDARKENKWVKWIKPASTNLVAMSDFLKSEFHRNHDIVADHVIYNGVTSTFTNLPKDIDLIAAGSLIPLKQFNVFVDVIAALKKQHPNISAVLVGKGPEESSLKRLIKNFVLEDTIRMVGEVDHETLMTLMNRSKILVHPSGYEGYSTVCLEALANACHVVSFTYAEKASVTNWHLVNDTFEMVATVNQLLNSEERISPVVVRDMETIAKQMVALFDR